MGNGMNLLKHVPPRVYLAPCEVVKLFRIPAWIQLHLRLEAMLVRNLYFK